MHVDLISDVVSVHGHTWIPQQPGTRTFTPALQPASLRLVRTCVHGVAMLEKYNGLMIYLCTLLGQCLDGFDVHFLKLMTNMS